MITQNEITEKKFPIITVEQRMAEKRGIKGVILGKSGIGKTSLLWTLPSKSTLFLNLEGGDLAVEGWTGDSFSPATWNECQNLAVYLGGPDPSLANDQVYSKAHHGAMCDKYGDPKQLDKYETIFVDSITVAARLCFRWANTQPQAFSEKTGKPDIRGAYGLHGKEMINWLTHLQHIKNKNIWFVGILDEKLDDLNRKYFTAQLEGQKTSLELPGIVDQIITMADLNNAEGKPYRAFVTQTLNPYGFPAKDRSGRLNLLEEPNLAKLMDKIRSPLSDRAKQLTFVDPKEAA
jgi:AAA domain